MAKPWRCRLGRHKWVRRSTEDGQLFQQCSQCGKDNDQNKLPPSSALGM
ncbi:hypothetical protein [Actinoplanes friuliensis]|nr:hypothetical protein [Actinoplanes friuliensis]